ncbi:MAG TPA: hypothetical protein PKD53_15265 [Chloroflexaceae bacterium]|nr:hypothetical protein [Chloroflexaceae bacterium]
MTLAPWHAEIVELHNFFQGWLGGTLPATDEVYARLSDTQTPEFVIVTPGGEFIPSEQLLAQLRAAHGSRFGWRMWIENAELRFMQGGLTVATYEEWQRHADGTVTGRLSTVIFRDQTGTPNGLVWVQVHETWLPEAVQQRGRP